MMVPLHYLGCNGFHFQPQFFADIFFHIGVNVRIGADGAGQFAHAHVFRGPFHPLNVPQGLAVPEQQLQAEGGRFRMNAVGTADGRHIFEFHGTAFQHFRQLLQIFQDYVRSLLHLHIQARILHVRGSKAHVDIFGFVAHVFRHGRQKRDDVVVDFLIDLMNTVYIKIRFGFNDLHRFFGNAPQLRIGFAGSDLHIQHGLPFIPFVPDLLHFRTRVSRNHLVVPLLHLQLKTVYIALLNRRSVCRSAAFDLHSSSGNFFINARILAAVSVLSSAVVPL